MPVIADVGGQRISINPRVFRTFAYYEWNPDTLGPNSPPAQDVPDVSESSGLTTPIDSPVRLNTPVVWVRYRTMTGVFVSLFSRQCGFWSRWYYHFSSLAADSLDHMNLWHSSVSSSVYMPGLRNN